jgi:hypothetical protein
MNEQEQVKMKIGDSLAGLKTHNGCKVLIHDIIFPLYKDAIDTLVKGEDVNARAMLIAIRTIVEKVDDSIKLSEQLSVEFKDELNKHSGTPQ